ncbi:MAG: M20/M25/M40 family metallo-hydrolase [Proteobacteria bacterium]|nr:M20/M25/M40 family metallo-hydrolase [Pseudomonadota bacterium]
MVGAFAGALFSCTILSAGAAEEPVNLDMINRIMDQGSNHSEVMETLRQMTDEIGPRLTGSPGMRAANDWALEKFRGWGLTNPHLEGFDFGRGWSFEKSVVRMTTPRLRQLYALPVAWMPGTGGVISGPAIHAVIKKKEDFEKYEGKLEGKIVLISKPRGVKEPSNKVFRRLTEDDLAKKTDYQIPDGKPVNYERFADIVLLRKKMYTFLAEEGALAVVRISPRDAHLIEASDYLHRIGDTPTIPGVVMASEDYGRVVRLLKNDHEVTLELETEVTYYDDDPQAYNTIAEIPGRGRNPEIVMAGAHFDSWIVGDGAVDNGAGSAVVMEAARILTALNIRPRRTIRFALWSGEEQALFGSIDYVTRHLATRPETDDEDKKRLGKFFTMADQWPITTKPGHAKFSAYFNLDNGSGKIRGIFGEGNLALQPIFESWFAPFNDMGAATVILGRTGGTDHLSFQWAGLPAFQFIQDPLDYGSRLHHTQIDTLDHVQAEDLRQASIIMASFLYHAAMRDDKLPRKPLPMRPTNGRDDEDEDEDESEDEQDSSE